MLLILGGILSIAKGLKPSAAKEESVHHPWISAMWLSQFDLAPILTHHDAQREKKDYTERIRILLNNIQANGINTLFVQVRPNGDSLYPSDLFPSSAYAVGKTGTAFLYDPFAILLELAHERNLSVHAWINPLRLFSDVTQIKLSEDFPALQWCRDNNGRAVLVDGIWYLNPAYEETRKLVSAGAAEILDRYAVDGIHIDDYFYPTTSESFDHIAFAEYQKKGGTCSLGDFRRDAVNRLVASLYQTVHTAKGSHKFGISPSGNAQRNYEELYADVAHWCANTGYVDYICPQIYFGLEHGTHDFRSVAAQFDAMIQEESVALYIGMTLEKAYNGFYGKEDIYAKTGSREWIESQNVLARCFTYTQELRHANGVAFFSYRLLFSTESGNMLKATEKEWQALLPLLMKKGKK
ncbi:MAG: family 10 glycosylhydrolase [Clostridia bacterium]|nr:family 10 glycosylhydrolase [Clostridia bacterium]